VRSWLRHHRSALRAAFGKLAAQRAGGIVSALVIGVALALPAGGYALLEGVSALTPRVALEPQISVYLKSSSSKTDAEKLGARLKADPRVDRVRFVSREDALKQLKGEEGLSDVVAALDRNPLPDAFVLRMRDSNPETQSAVAEELRHLPVVSHVQADAVWARRLASLTRIGRLAVLLLAGLLAFGLVAVTFNTIRLQILTQRDEIEVSKLIGATDAFIRRPFLYLGLVQGLAGGALALAIVWVGLALLNSEVRPLAQSYGSSFGFGFLSRGDALAVVLFAGALGWLGASLSVSRYLREIQPK
jgi:cell division transport system permease protein